MFSRQRDCAKVDYCLSLLFRIIMLNHLSVLTWVFVETLKKSPCWSRIEHLISALRKRSHSRLRQLNLALRVDKLKYKLSKDVMYEFSCNTMKPLKLIERTTFDQNQFMTCYLIFNFRPTFFSYFRKITSFFLIPLKN